MKIRFRIRKWLYLTCTFFEAVAVIFSNRLKSSLRFKYAPSSTNTFLKLFLLHAFGRQPKLKVTCTDRTDGAAAQAHTIISAMNFARFYGHIYVHTPFTEIDHADRPVEQWVAAWEDAFNLGEGEGQFQPDMPGVINYSTFHPRLYHFVNRAIRNERPGDAEKHFHPFFYFSDCNPDSYETIIPRLREKYYRGKSPVKSKELTVAVHVRRGDVRAEHHHRFTAIHSVFETARQVKTLLDSDQAKHTITVFSQGDDHDFSEFLQLDANLCLNYDAVLTMRQLIEADILIMSKGSFSYVAALLSEGIKLYEPFWHSPLEPWIVRDPGGNFDSGAFESQFRKIQTNRLSGN